jgi:murein DD-endopeptidase MepM/ murein hydrolase activator NlpD
MKNRSAKTTALLIAFTVAFFLFGVSYASPGADDLRRIDEQLQAEKAKLREARAKESNALNKLYSVNKELNRAKTDLVRTQGQIYSGKKKITALEVDLKQTEADLSERGRLLSERLTEAYKNGWGLNLLELLFSSKSMDEFVSRQYYLEKMISADMSLLSEIKDKVAIVAETRRSLSSSISEMKDLEVDLSERKSEIEVQAKVKTRIYEDLKVRRLEYERRVAELEKSSREFEALINKSSAPGKGYGSATGKMMWPASGRIVSGFGYRRHPLWGGWHLHTGIDIGASYGEPVKAADGGEVIYSGWWDGYGKAVVIDHGHGTSTVYGHMSRIYAQTGQRLDKGQVIGLVGSTGFSTGPHLHFEVRRNGKPMNPIGFLM